MDHERQHAAIARQTLSAHAEQLRAEVIPQLKAASAAIGTNANQAGEAIGMRWKAILDGFFQRLRLDHERAQAALDTPEEYRRLQGLCP